MIGQEENIKLQLKNIDSQLTNFKIQTQNMGAINLKSQIMNIGIQILNIGLQTLSYADTYIAGIGENINNLENQILDISKQLNNMYSKNRMMMPMGMNNNMGMGMNNNMGMGMNNNMGMGMNNNMGMGMPMGIVNPNLNGNSNHSDISDNDNLPPVIQLDYSTTSHQNPIFKMMNK